MDCVSQGPETVRKYLSEVGTENTIWPVCTVLALGGYLFDRRSALPTIAANPKSLVYGSRIDVLVLENLPSSYFSH